MTQEYKDLLLRDLCARLPYGVMLKTDNVFPQKLEGITFDKDTFLVWVSDGGYTLENMECKPYLFPPSSMPEEQQKEFFDQLIELELKAISNEIDPKEAVEFEIDFYNKHHIDYRGLIPMGLAINATGLNIY